MEWRKLSKQISQEEHKRSQDELRNVLSHGNWFSFLFSAMSPFIKVRRSLNSFSLKLNINLKPVNSNVLHYFPKSIFILSLSSFASLNNTIYSQMKVKLHGPKLSRVLTS